MEGDELLVPLSALEHWSFCHRQCGLIHLENLWAESGRTAEGRGLHEKVDLPGLEQRPGMKVARALELLSAPHHLVGRADVVVFFEDPAYPAPGRPYPVEYKRSSRNTYRHAELQLCGQALCLETMLRIHVPAGALFFGASKRRREVEFTERLRDDTRRATTEILQMLESQRTPAPEPGAKCGECSLRDLCLPDLPATPALQAYFEGIS
jgi:CRISPR-associated exonuclease Cas4